MNRFVNYSLKSYLRDPHYCFTGAFAKPSNFEVMHDRLFSVLCFFFNPILMIQQFMHRLFLTSVLLQVTQSVVFVSEIRTAFINCIVFECSFIMYLNMEWSSTVVEGEQFFFLLALCQPEKILIRPCISCSRICQNE